MKGKIYDYGYYFNLKNILLKPKLNQKISLLAHPEFVVGPPHRFKKDTYILKLY